MCDAYPVSEDDENPVFSGSTTTHGFSGSTTTHQRHGSSASEPRSSFSLRRSLRATLPVESAAEVVAPQTDRMQDSGLMNRRDQQEARSESGFSKNRFSENQLRVQHLLHEDEEEEEEDHDAVVVGSLEESRLCFAPMFGEQDGDDIINGGSNNDGGGREEENDATISLFLHSVIGGLPGEHEQGHDFRKNDFSAAAWTDDRAGRLQKSTTLLEDSGGTRIPEAGAPDGRWGDGKEKRSFSWGEKVEAVRDAPSMNTSVNTGSPLLLAGRYPTTTAAQFVNQRNSLHFSLDLAQKHTGNLANQSLLEALQHFGIARSGKEDQTAIPPGNGGAPASSLPPPGEEQVHVAREPAGPPLRFSVSREEEPLVSTLQQGPQHRNLLIDQTELFEQEFAGVAGEEDIPCSRIACRFCHRKFNRDRLEVHEATCLEKRSARTPWDSRRQRTRQIPGYYRFRSLSAGGAREPAPQVEKKAFQKNVDKKMSSEDRGRGGRGRRRKTKAKAPGLPTGSGSQKHTPQESASSPPAQDEVAGVKSTSGTASRPGEEDATATDEAEATTGERERSRAGERSVLVEELLRTANPAKTTPHSSTSSDPRSIDTLPLPLPRASGQPASSQLGELFGSEEQPPSESAAREKCPHCQRLFRPEALAIHERICVSVFGGTAKVPTVAKAAGQIPFRPKKRVVATKNRAVASRSADPHRVSSSTRALQHARAKASSPKPAVDGHSSISRRAQTAVKRRSPTSQQVKDLQSQRKLVHRPAGGGGSSHTKLPTASPPASDSRFPPSLYPVSPITTRVVEHQFEKIDTEVKDSGMGNGAVAGTSAGQQMKADAHAEVGPDAGSGVKPFSVEQVCETTGSKDPLQRFQHETALLHQKLEALLGTFNGSKSSDSGGSPPDHAGELGATGAGPDRRDAEMSRSSETESPEKASGPRLRASGRFFQPQKYEEPAADGYAPRSEYNAGRPAASSGDVYGMKAAQNTTPENPPPTNESRIAAAPSSKSDVLRSGLASTKEQENTAMSRASLSHGDRFSLSRLRFDPEEESSRQRFDREHSDEDSHVFLGNSCLSGSRGDVEMAGARIPSSHTEDLLRSSGHLMRRNDVATLEKLLAEARPKGAQQKNQNSASFDFSAWSEIRGSAAALSGDSVSLQTPEGVKSEGVKSSPGHLDMLNSQEGSRKSSPGHLDMLNSLEGQSTQLCKQIQQCTQKLLERKQRHQEAIRQLDAGA